MSNLSRIGLAVFFIAAILVVVYAYLPSGFWGHPPGTLPADKYVAIYEEYNEDWKILEGNGTVLLTVESTPVPKPFDFDGSLGYSEQYADAPGDFKVFNCVFYYYSSPAEKYTNPNYGCYNVPIYHLWLVANMAVYDIDENGTLNATYNNEPVIIKAGEKWQSPVKSEIKNQTFEIVTDGKTAHSGVFHRFKVQYNSTWIVENKGVFNKSNLKK